MCFTVIYVISMYQYTNTITSLSFPTKTHNLTFFPNTSTTASSLPQFHQTHHQFCLFFGLLCFGFQLFALNKRGAWFISQFERSMRTLLVATWYPWTCVISYLEGYGNTTEILAVMGGTTLIA